MTLSLGTAYRSFGGEVEASSTLTICRLPDSRRHQLWAITRGYLSWKYIYSRHGRPRWYNIGRADIGLAKARAEAAKLLVLVNDGKDPRLIARPGGLPRPSGSWQSCIAITPRRKTNHGHRPMRWSRGPCCHDG